MTYSAERMMQWHCKICMVDLSKSYSCRCKQHGRNVYLSFCLMPLPVVLLCWANSLKSTPSLWHHWSIRLFFFFFAILYSTCPSGRNKSFRTGAKPTLSLYVEQVIVWMSAVMALLRLISHAWLKTMISFNTNGFLGYYELAFHCHSTLYCSSSKFV